MIENINDKKKILIKMKREKETTCLHDLPNENVW